MEVHHHPSVERKRLKEYLLEFIMIFLAVTLGFFAETIRESITEHKKAKEYAESMLRDLQLDTAQLRIYRLYYNYSADNIDTLQQLLAHADPKDIPPGKLYWYGLFGGAHRNFVPNDETFQQMKSSGSLRFFGKTVASDAAKYDRFCRVLQSAEQMQQEVYGEVRKLRAQIFEFRYNDIANTISQRRFRNWNYSDYDDIDSLTKAKLPLLSYDRTLFNQYVEMVRSRFIRTYNVGYADSLLRQASVLIGELEDNYHLKE